VSTTPGRVQRFHACVWYWYSIAAVHAIAIFAGSSGANAKVPARYCKLSTQFNAQSPLTDRSRIDLRYDTTQQAHGATSTLLNRIVICAVFCARDAIVCHNQSFCFKNQCSNDTYVRSSGLLMLPFETVGAGAVIWAEPGEQQNSYSITDTMSLWAIDGPRAGDVTGVTLTNMATMRSVPPLQICRRYGVTGF